MEEYVLLCRDTPESVFTAIYQVYAHRLPRDRVRLQIGSVENYRLFATYREVCTDLELAARVVRTLRRQFGEEVYKDLCLALAAEDAEKAQAVYGTVVLGLECIAQGRRERITDHLTDRHVRRVMELSRRANNELMHMRGFLRFQEMDGGMLYAVIGPRDNILAMLAPHFADRLSGENFVIYDEKRSLAALHPAGEQWYLVHQAEEMMGSVELGVSPEENKYGELFRHFCNNISINERKNQELQRNMLPLRFRKYMTEFVGK